MIIYVTDMEVAVLKWKKDGIDGDLWNPELILFCPISFVPHLIY